jgi:hypothetical protein
MSTKGKRLFACLVIEELEKRLSLEYFLVAMAPKGATNKEDMTDWGQ